MSDYSLFWISRQNPNFAGAGNDPDNHGGIVPAITVLAVRSDIWGSKMWTVGKSPSF